MDEEIFLARVITNGCTSAIISFLKGEETGAVKNFFL